MKKQKRERKKRKSSDRKMDMISNPKSTNLKSLKNRKKQLERINKKDNAKKDRQRKNILNLKISIGKRYSSNRLNPSIARSRG